MLLGYNEQDQIICIDQPKSQVLFQHCSEGMIAVTSEYFNEMTRPLLELHGVHHFKWEDTRILK